MTTDQIIALIDSGMDLAAINADKRTRQPIPLQALEALMHRTGLGLMLAELADSDMVSSTVAVAIRSFLAYVASPRQTNLSAHEPDVAANLDAVMQAVVAQDAQYAALVEQVYALGGGRLVDEPVSQEAYDAALAKIGRRDLFTAALEQMRRRHAEEITALETWYETGEGEAPELDDE